MLAAYNIIGNPEDAKTRLNSVEKLLRRSTLLKARMRRLISCVRNQWTIVQNIAQRDFMPILQ
jgi:hypothetical protein